MTQEEKQLLLKDLAARVPYGVIVEQTLFPPTLADKEQRLKSVQANECVKLYWYKYIDEFVPIHCIKPYLRPMSSMTEEEYKEFSQIEFNAAQLGIYEDCMRIDFLNSHYFDYRELIEKGLAIEAPEEMYKNEEK